MKIRINKKVFKTHLDRMSKAITTVSALPSLTGLLINVSQSNIQMTASDGNLSIKEVIEINGDVEIIEPGLILVPGKIFQNVISKHSSIITVETSDRKMKVNSDGISTEINLFDETDYPSISFETLGKELLIKTSVIQKIIKNVSYAAAVGDKRVILNGVNLKASNGKLIASATNSYRLAREVASVNSTNEFDITILSKNLKDFIPTNTKDEMIITVDDTKIVTRVGSTIVSSRLIDGDYLPVERLMSSEYESKLTINKSELDAVVDRATVLSPDNKKVIKVLVDESIMLVESKKTEVGESNSKTSNMKFEGQKLEIVFDASFLKDAISHFVGEITLSFNGPQKPFTVTGESDPNLLNLILPHRSF